MSRVRTGLSISLDGFIGGLGELGWPVHERLHGWKFGLASFYEAIGEDGGEDNADSRLLAEQNAHIGAFVMGKGMFDAGEEPWGDTPPFGAPVFILTHAARETVLKEGGTSYTFVADGIESALAQAKAAAFDKDVFISGGASAVQQALAAGLVDELELHVIPVLLGDGVRLFERLGREIELEPLRVVASPNATHLTYKVKKTQG